MGLELELLLVGLELLVLELSRIDSVQAWVVPARLRIDLSCIEFLEIGHKLLLFINMILPILISEIFPRPWNLIADQVGVFSDITDDGPLIFEAKIDCRRHTLRLFD